MTCWMREGTRLVGVTNSYLIVPSVDQHVTLLVNRNLPGDDKRRLLRGMNPKNPFATNQEWSAV